LQPLLLFWVAIEMRSFKAAIVDADQKDGFYVAK
jgi:hypothetical protein